MECVLFSGASGMLGAALRAEVQRQGAKTQQLVRRSPQSVDEVEWQPNAPDAGIDRSALQGLTAAIHLSGANVAAHRWTIEYQEEIVRSRVDSTRVLATMLAGLQDKPKVLLVASATGIYGDRGDEVLTEASAPGAGFLARVCEKWEEAARPAVEAGIRVVHLRFGVVLGRGAGALAKMVPLFKFGLGGKLGSGKQWMSWIDLQDAAHAVSFLLSDASISGAVNLVAPHPVTNAEFTRALGRALHRPALVTAPAFALRLAMGQMADEALLASARVLPSRLLDAGFQFEQPRIENALQHLV